MGKLFGTDGIRGIVGENLTVELAFHTGQAIAAVLKEEKGRAPLITIGKDCQAHLLETISPDYPSFLIWMDEEKGAAFLIDGYVSPEELIRVAESVQAQ